MQVMNFVPSKNEPDIWMRQNGDIYKYVVLYVDDLAFVMKDPTAFEQLLHT